MHSLHRKHSRCWTGRRGVVARVLLLFPLWLVLLMSPASAVEYFERYELRAQSPALDLGGQPLGYPSGILSSVMARDRILREALSRAGHPLSVHAFQRGADMVALLSDQRLEAGLLGDMPTLLSAASGATVIVGLVKQASTAVVARGEWHVQALAGKRIGYVEASSAHHTLLQGLAAAGLGEADVTLVKMRVDEMAPALARGDIDAFAGWEPAPSIALAASNRHRIVFRGLSTDYFVINKAFAERDPEAARLLVAGYVRAIQWLRLSRRHVERAAAWTQADGEVLSGSKAAVDTARIVAITRRDILDVAGAPAIIRRPRQLPLQREFEFLKNLGKLPAGASESQLQAAFAYDGLSEVNKAPSVYRVRETDYVD